MGCRTGGLAGQWGSPRPRSATAWTCCCPSWPPSGTASPTGGSSPPLKTCANGLGRWPQPARRSWSTGSAPGCSGPPAGSTRRSCTTPSGTPIPPRGWRCRPSGATCCGATVAGRAAATSRSSSSWRGWARCWTPPAWRACWTGGFGAWPRPVRTGTRRSGTAGPKTGSATRSGRSTACRRGCARWWSSPIAHLANAWALRRWRGLLYRVRDVYRAAGCTESPHDKTITDTLNHSPSQRPIGPTTMTLATAAVLSHALGFLPDQDHSNAVGCWELAPAGRGDEHLRDRDLEPLAALRQRCRVPNFGAVGGAQGGEIEVGWRPELLDLLEDGVPLELQAGHHPVPPRHVISGGKLTADVPGFLEVHDPAANSIQPGLEEGALAFPFRHGELPPALGDGTKDRVVRLHRGEPRPELPHDLRVGCLHLDGGGCWAGSTGSCAGAVVVEPAPVIGPDPTDAHGVGASPAAGHPNKQIAGGAPTAGSPASLAGLCRTLPHDRCTALQLHQHPGVLAGRQDAFSEAHWLAVRAEHNPSVMPRPAHKGRAAEESDDRLRAPPGRHSLRGFAAFRANLDRLRGSRCQDPRLVQRYGDLASGLPLEEPRHDPTDDGCFVGVRRQPPVNDQVAVRMPTGPLTLEAAALTPRLDAPRERVRLVASLLGEERDDRPVSGQRAVQVLPGEDDPAPDRVDGVQHLADVPHP